MTSPVDRTPGWPSERSRTGGVDEIPLPRPPGRLWLAGKHFVGPDPEAAMARTGATAVVCLNERHELVDRYPGYVEWLETEAPGRALWHPVPDLHAPRPDAARALVAELVTRLDGGASLLVHCGAGIGRAGTVAVAVLVDMGMPLDAALDSVARHRPGAGPEAGAQTELLVTLAEDPPRTRGRAL